MPHARAFAVFFAAWHHDENKQARLSVQPPRSAPWRGLAAGALYASLPACWEPARLFFAVFGRRRAQWVSSGAAEMRDCGTAADVDGVWSNRRGVGESAQRAHAVVAYRRGPLRSASLQSLSWSKYRCFV